MGKDMGMDKQSCGCNCGQLLAKVGSFDIIQTKPTDRQNCNSSKKRQKAPTPQAIELSSLWMWEYCKPQTISLLPKYPAFTFICRQNNQHTILYKPPSAKIHRTYRPSAKVHRYQALIPRFI